MTAPPAKLRLNTVTTIGTSAAIDDLTSRYGEIGLRILPSLEIPALAELARSPAWVCWRAMQRKGKLTKVPFTPAGSAASTTDPRTWSRYAECFAAAFVRGDHDGIGRVLTGRDDLIGIDLDDQRDPLPGIVSYAELSPSGNGLHIWCRGSWPTNGNKRGGIEVYRRYRFLTVTGNHLDGTPTEIKALDLDPLWHEHFAGRNNGSGDARLVTEIQQALDLPEHEPDPIPRDRLARLAHLCPQLRRVLENAYGGHRALKDLALVRFAKLAGWHPRAAWRLLLSYDNPKAAGRPGYAARTIGKVYLEDAG
jgi:hypothetical protein